MSSPIEPGALLGPFRIESELGRGGMGVVLRARDERLGRLVALKVLRRDFGIDPRAVERFRREAAAGSRVAHPNVVAVHATGEDAGLLWMASELVPGGSLEARLRREGRLPWREAALLGAGVARGLAALHAAGIVHRDVKPANVLLDAEGTPKVCDFGLSRVLDGGPRSRLTQADERLGTAGYMAPEQAEGGNADARSDLYGLGATLHALVAGSPPFERGPSYVVLKKQLVDGAPRLRTLVADVPEALDALVARLLQAEPAARGDSAAAVAQELDSLARGPTGRGRSRALGALGVGLAVALGAATVAFVLARVAAKVRAPTATPSPRVSPTPSPRVSPTPSPSPTPGLRVAATLDLRTSESPRVLAGSALSVGRSRGVVGTTDGDLVVFSLADLRVLARQKVARQRVSGVALDSAESFVVACTDCFEHPPSTIGRFALPSLGTQWSLPVPGRCLALALAEERKEVYFAFHGGWVVHDLALGNLLDTAFGDRLALTIGLAPGSHVWTSHRDGSIRLWRRESSPELLWSYHAPGKARRTPCKVAVAADGTYVAGWDEGGVVLGGPGTDDPRTLAETGQLRNVAISADGKLALVAEVGGPVSLWDLARAEKIAQLRLEPEQHVLRLAFIGTGPSFLCAGVDGLVRRVVLER